MANEKQVEILLKGVEYWNRWRAANPVEVIMENRHLSLPISYSIDLSGADLRGQNLIGGNFFKTDFGNANLDEANLNGANLRYAHFNFSTLQNTDFTGAVLAWTEFGFVNLASSKGLELVQHEAPCSIGIETMLMSKGQIPERFALGCGVPEALIRYFPSIFGAVDAIQFHSCFISYSHKDESFATHLCFKMKMAGLRVWYAHEDVRSGQKLHEQIDSAIRFYDKLLIVISENSMKSEWVITEIRKARKIEKLTDKRKLFPIRLVDFETIRAWECFDADTGKDLAVECREYLIPDFSNWKDHDAFEAAFKRLHNDLKA